MMYRISSEYRKNGLTLVAITFPFTFMKCLRVLEMAVLIKARNAPRVGFSYKFALT